MSHPAFRVGDQVELLHALPFRRALRQGLQGVVLVAEGQEFHWLTIQFPGHQRPHRVAPRHLVLAGAGAGADGPSRAPRAVHPGLGRATAGAGGGGPEHANDGVLCPLAPPPSGREAGH